MTLGSRRKLEAAVRTSDETGAPVSRRYLRYELPRSSKTRRSDCASRTCSGDLVPPADAKAGVTGRRREALGRVDFARRSTERPATWTRANTRSMRAWGTAAGSGPLGREERSDIRACQGVAGDASVPEWAEGSLKPSRLHRDWRLGERDGSRFPVPGRGHSPRCGPGACGCSASGSWAGSTARSSFRCRFSSRLVCLVSSFWRFSYP